MITFLSVSTLLLLCAISLTHAHVVMLHPTPRTDNDYLFTFEDGICAPETTCAAFCGDPYDIPANPLTILQVGVPIILRWRTNIAHRPRKYRLSLNPNATDDHFDISENILATVTNRDAADPSNDGPTGTFSTNVTIPESALETCSQADGDKPCVLQLWDLYYFVSCANVLLTTEVPPTPSPATLPPPQPTPAPATLSNPILYDIANPDRLRSVAYHPEGNRLASGGLDDIVRIWDMDNNGSSLHNLTGHTANILSVCYNHDGTKLASGSHDETIRVWDMSKDGALLYTLKGHTSVVKTVSFSRDGTRLASGSNDRSVKVWDVESGLLLHNLDGHSDKVRSVSWSADRSRLASGAWDDTILVWDMTTLEILHSLTGHASNVNAVAFSPDGNTLASASSDKTVIIWDFITGLQLSSVKEHTANIRDLSYDHSGDRLASVSEDKTVNILNTKNPAEVVLQNKLTGHTGNINTVSFSPDGTLASGANDNTIIIWSVPLITNAPTSTPPSTPPTTSSTTPTPTITCVNDPNFKLKNNKKKTCAWVMLKRNRRNRFCIRTPVRTSCPISCGLCCADTDTFKFIVGKKMRKKNCIWLGKGKGSRAKKNCTRNIVKTGCAETCDNCFN